VARLKAEKVVEALGRRVAELRAEHGLTQAQLARALGKVTPQRVARIEAGANLTVFSLVAIANQFGVAIDELFRDPDDLTKPKRGRPRKKRPSK
jgi:transcriptional regulator with XRE-family HTH domain